MEHISNQLQELRQNSNQKTSTKNFDEVELTEEEKDAAILVAKKHKFFREQEQAYWDRVNRHNNDFKNISAEELLQFCIDDVSQKENIDNFFMDEHRKKYYETISWYFSKDKRFEDEGYSFKKGLFLQGNVGCGKTILMKTFRINPRNRFGVISCREVTYKYQQFGDEIFQKYSIVQDDDTSHGWCFDDLGTESVKKHYGNETNVMAEILLNRYDRKLFHKTHITTNLTVTELEEIYGSRLQSRFREMFNLISFPMEATDLRK